MRFGPSTHAPALAFAGLSVSLLLGCLPGFPSGDAADASVDGAVDGSASREDGGADSPAPPGADASQGTDASTVADASTEDGSTDADAAPDGPPRTSQGCPATPGTTAMLRFDVPPLGSFCIDVKEVTNDQFNRFALAAAPVFTVPVICASETEGGLPPASSADPQLPAGYVSFCDAWAYCSWANKRLCGRIGGQHSSGTGSRTFDEWSYACANGSKATTYPYGPTYDAGACNTGTLDAGATIQAPGSFPGCHGTDPGFDQLFDMSGNIAEYDDWAETYTDDDASDIVAVHTLGGSYENNSPNSCDEPGGQFGQANRSYDNAGFRCCATPSP